MRPFLFFVLFFLASCGSKQPSFEFGQMTKADLVSLKGEPLKEQGTSSPNGSTFIYPNEEKFQLKGETVTHRLRNPENGEKTVLFWQHHFKDCSSKLQALKADKKSHAPKQFQLSCDELGTAVIYLEDSPYIDRVIEYEKQ